MLFPPIGSLVPEEIKKIGEEATAIYLQALYEGKVQIPNCNLLILGNQEVGKTRLVRQLIGKDFLIELVELTTMK